jgi:hypothetical protein
MVAMNPRLVVLLLCASLIPAMQARAKTKTILPDACGDDSIKFDVTPFSRNNMPPPAPPEAGKAQIIFVGSVPYEDKGFPTIRFGVDGAWAGATKDNSYFAVTVDPGVHNLCVSAQGTMHAIAAPAKDFVDMASVTAEPGKVYYFMAAFNVIGGRNGGGVASFGLTQLNEAEGRYRVKAWKLATWTTDK